MSLSKVSSGKNLPHDINVVIEISTDSKPVKYEVDKETGTLHVDRFLGTSMVYPCEYGYVPNTLAEDGDPVDVLVVCPFPLLSGSVVRCRPIGMLRMTDDGGPDAKILTVPVSKLTPIYDAVKQPEDLGKALMGRIEHFFTHYKDLEPNKWVKIDGWADSAAALAEIKASADRFVAGK